jgi:integrator complex subunit 4
VLHERGLKIDPELYADVCNALKDDNKIVRQDAMVLIYILACSYPDKYESSCFVKSHSTTIAFRILTLGTSEQEIRLADDAFGKLSSCINDLSLNVRVQAVTILGNFGGNLVKSKFLVQTLHKKLMSNMRVRLKFCIVFFN